MYNCGLALVHCPLNKLSSRVIVSLNEARSCVRQVLYIKVDKLTSPLDSPSSESVATNPDEDNLSYVPYIYRAASHYTPNLDVRVLLKEKFNAFQYKPEILLTNYDQTSSKVSQILDDYQPIEFKHIQCDDDALQDEMEIEIAKEPPPRYDHVCLGGTFDGLHDGHKVLLSEAIIRSRQSLTVGVTDVNMLKKKLLWELIRSTSERIDIVKKFVQDVFDDIHYKIVPINDPFGPAIEDEKLGCIVVSEETSKGAVKINEIRSERKMKPLDTVTIKIVVNEHRMTDFEEVKVSSSSLRIGKLGKLRNPPRTYSGEGPYLIGLTGGIASGKTSVCEQLRALGAGVINADTVAHETYQTPDSPGYSTLIDVFGPEIVDKMTMNIDRKELGAKVFSDPAKLAKLNSIIWPLTQKAIEERVSQLQSAHKVIVVEAALLIEADWHKKGIFHQIWVTIIPPDEAIKRLKDRNNLNEEDAKKRISSQLDNWTRVQSANVVFSSEWDHNFTRLQCEKAWNSLKEFVNLG
ncbi:bifunctional coenzyme A synthase-like [Brevipalpus obovatus]|uniref:bifunctional coenzyme A synthase-like n=1 Tax=Brevipalpus obovatus TaxID=246614 RepID=UPI003D9DF1E6